MDVTKSNFKAVLPDVKVAITNADFLTIDCEFTGLNCGLNVNAFDTPKQYFEKIQKGSTQFLVLQFGVCAFRYDAIDKAFKYQSFNFYIFPRQNNRLMPDRKFLCQASSIEFLSNQDFDFNKVFKEGITYLHKNDEEKIRDQLLERQKFRANNLTPQNNGCNNSIPIPPEDYLFIENTMRGIEDFLLSGDKELVLPTCSPFHRKLIYQTAKERFGTTTSLESRILENKDRTIVVTKILSTEQLKQKEKKKCEEELLELEDAVGFSAVIRHISESGKMIIGHNMLLDITHIIDKFLMPLPSNYEEFKECLHCLFPKIIDTKFMSHSEHFRDSIKSSVLSHILDTVHKTPFELPNIKPEKDSIEYKLDSGREHEAGYDAYITGLCFLGMAQFIEKMEFRKNFTFGDSKILLPFLNKLFLMKIQDHPYINITGKDVVPNRDHVLHITFPKEWKTCEITQLFSPFGNVQVAWLGENSAYVALHKREQASAAMSSLSMCDDRTYTLMSYARHQAQLQLKSLPHSNFSAVMVPSPCSVRKKRDPDPQMAVVSHQPDTKKRRKVTSFGDILKDYCRNKNGKLTNKERKSRICIV